MASEEVSTSSASMPSMGAMQPLRAAADTGIMQAVMKQTVILMLFLFRPMNGTQCGDHDSDSSPAVRHPPRTRNDELLTSSFSRRGHFARAPRARAPAQPQPARPASRSS